MRFCPFCSAENADELATCAACGRRLPPLPPRRARNAPPTGVQLPPRPHTQSQPPPLPRPATKTVPPQGMQPIQPGVMVSPGAVTARPGSHAELPVPALEAPTVVSPPPALRESAPSLPPPPAVTPPPADDDARRSLLSAISPGPAAVRRDPPPAEPRDPLGAARRASDQSSTMPASPRAKPLTVPPATPPSVTAPGTGIFTVAPAQRSGPIPSVTGPRSKPTTLPPATPGSGPRPIPAVAPTTYPVVPPAASPFNDDFNTMPSAEAYPPEAADEAGRAVQVAASRAREHTGVEPPPTRINRPEALTDRPFAPPKVNPVPEIPEPGLYNSARYAVRFGRARWQRRGAIRTLGAEIKQDTEALDQVLGALGRVARSVRVDGRVFSAENAAITSAEMRVEALAKEHSDVDARKADENSKFVDVERERNTKLSEAERMVDEASKELAHLEAQRRGLRDKRKELERRIKAYLKSADDSERQAGAQQMGDARQELRRAAEQHRKEAAALEPDRQEVDRRLASLERPIGEATAKLDAAKAELDAAKRSLSDAREGHTHRLAELDAEQKRKSRDMAQAEGEIARRLVTLGTLVNLNRIDDPQFSELYLRIDRLRSAITARTTEIEKLTAEREAYDRGTLVRGLAAMGGAVVAFIALIVILRAIF